MGEFPIYSGALSHDAGSMEERCEVVGQKALEGRYALGALG